MYSKQIGQFHCYDMRYYKISFFVKERKKRRKEGGKGKQRERKGKKEKKTKKEENRRKEEAHVEKQLCSSKF